MSIGQVDAVPEWVKAPSQPNFGPSSKLPETRPYRVKRRLLGPPLSSDQLHAERLGKPTALAVLSSDVMSSCAYATESILRILVPAAGIAAFSLVTPATLLLLVVLALVCLCYRQVVRAYPVSGGSYVVSRENFGYAVAQIPAAALVCSYILTVAVSVAAGVDAVISAFPVFTPYPIELSVAFVLLLTFGNLRGIREAGPGLRRSDLLVPRQHGGAPRGRHGPVRGAAVTSRATGCTRAGMCRSAPLAAVFCSARRCSSSCVRLRTAARR